MNLPFVEMGLNRPLPIEVTRVTAPFWEGLTRGLFLVTRCEACKRPSFPPRIICPQCHGRDFEWEPVCGKGTLYSASKIEQSPPLHGILSPMRVAIVDLEEGIRVVTRLLPGQHSVALDGKVQLVITHHPDGYHYAVRMEIADD